MYIVEKIVKMRKHHGKREYSVKWQGYTSKMNTWETEKNLMENCEEEIEAFRKGEEEKSKGAGGKAERKSPKKRGKK